MELRDRAVGMRCDQPLQLVEAVIRPGGEGRADLCLHRVVAREDRRRRLALTFLEERSGAREVESLAIAPNAELEPERRHAGAGLRDGPRSRGRLAARLEERDSHGPRRRDNRGARDDRENTRAGAPPRSGAGKPSPPLFAGSVEPTPSSTFSLASVNAAIFGIVMPSYRELLQQVKGEIDEVDAPSARELLDSIDPPLLVDVREQDEWNEGHLPGAVHVPRGNLESRIERAAPDRSRSIVLYCQAGNRSAFAAKTLEDLGYENVVSLAGGYTDWKRNGFPTQLPRVLDAEKRSRYSRHLLIPEVGEEGQLKLLDSRVLLVGAGGLGSPASLYLAAAGVGGSESSTTTGSTPRTSSARSRTRRSRSANGRPTRRSAPSKRSTRTWRS